MDAIFVLLIIEKRMVGQYKNAKCPDIRFIRGSDSNHNVNTGAGTVRLKLITGTGTFASE